MCHLPSKKRHPRKRPHLLIRHVKHGPAEGRERVCPRRVLPHLLRARPKVIFPAVVLDRQPCVTPQKVREDGLLRDKLPQPLVNGNLPIELRTRQSKATQLNRQGADEGTQYRSAIFFTGPEQEAAASSLCESFQEALTKAGYGRIVTQVAPAGDWYYAEDYHQQYLEANPDGYCPVHATGVRCGTD